jgi:cytochrome c-type biogenesis protein CcmH
VSGAARSAREGRRGRLAALAALLVLALAAPVAAPAAPVRKTSLPQIERQVMCVTCKIPLNVAESPQADRERAFIQSLIDQGEDETQIKSALVEQYGPAVLGLPAAHGFDLTAYLVPLAAVLALVALLIVLLPRWRRRAREQGEQRPPAQPISTTDAARLDSDLARFDR